jgi:hypothetical protein
MKKRVHVIPLDQLADPPPLWRRVYFHLQLGVSQLQLKVIFAGLLILAILFYVYVLVNTGKVVAGTLFFELGLLVGLSFLFPWILYIPVRFINSNRVFVVWTLSCWAGASSGTYMLTHFIIGYFFT